MGLSGEFPCSLCDAVAGTVRPKDGGVERVSFTSTMWLELKPQQHRPLRAALEAVDARALHAVHYELAPFYCPDCDASYCGRHWQKWDVFDDDDPSWHDSVHGRCPQGHERMLED